MGQDSQNYFLHIALQSLEKTRLSSAIEMSLKEENDFFCENCKSNQIHVGHVFFATLPKILIIQILRYGYVEGEGQKNELPLEIPEYLLISNHTPS